MCHCGNHSIRGPFLLMVVAVCLKQNYSEITRLRIYSKLHNTLRPGDSYMRQWTGSSLVQIMACCLFGAMTLSKPILAFCQLEFREPISVKLSNNAIAIHDNAFVIVLCKTGAILSCSQHIRYMRTVFCFVWPILTVFNGCLFTHIFTVYFNGIGQSVVLMPLG